MPYEAVDIVEYQQSPNFNRSSVHLADDATRSQFRPAVRTGTPVRTVLDLNVNVSGDLVVKAARGVIV
ncbi:hypothetical protein PENSOL_c041G02318 [Penicillium solitum]|uniref:Uncharacterized protein n=1 Tax=Penicillium solitum TaxID=60172 RepID=A0A1V6QTV9_9EURO|nr:uncharacterized protein PENSOL_c041G02318 [Penicillium solitum]OQD92437.1 hypothetical protein PENSOL_c041G02318 [Penicillium solitum]